MTGNLSEAVRGPLLLIALGSVLAADQLDRIDLGRTWPVLLILFALLKLAEHLARSMKSERRSEAEGGGA
jgi:hypothetical protein